MGGAPQQVEPTGWRARKWAIETGIIEGLYHIDRGVTTYLYSPPEQTASEMESLVSLHHYIRGAEKLRSHHDERKREEHHRCRLREASL